MNCHPERSAAKSKDLHFLQDAWAEQKPGAGNKRGALHLDSEMWVFRMLIYAKAFKLPKKTIPKPCHPERSPEGT
jgi:hypothetical protein